LSPKSVDREGLGEGPVQQLGKARFENITFITGDRNGNLDLCLRKTQAGKSHGYRVVVVFEKSRLQIVFCPNENVKPAFSNWFLLGVEDTAHVTIERRLTNLLF